MLAGATPAAATARILLPAAVLVPVALGGVVVPVERAGVFDAAFGNALLAAGNALLLSLLVIGTTHIGAISSPRRMAPRRHGVIQDGRLVFVNRRIADLLRYERADDMTGLDALAVIHQDDRDRAAARVASGARNLETLAISVIDNGLGFSSERAPRDRESPGLTSYTT